MFQQKHVSEERSFMKNIKSGCNETSSIETYNYFFIHH